VRPELVSLLVSLVGALPDLIAALTPEAQATVREQLEKHRADANCAACHQASGAGVPNAFPGLVQSKVVLGPAAEQIQLVLHGRKGVFAPTSVMPGMGTLSDVDIAAAITYTRHAWGNNAAEGLVQPAQVKAARTAK
jgi:mono/diheme cytochrome c family protein